jgi:hypothetical protein
MLAASLLVAAHHLKHINMNIRIYLPVIVCLSALSFIGIPVHAGSVVAEPPSKETIASMTKEQKEARLEEMKERVKEIKAMDKSKLTKEERKALRMELKSMNKEAHAMGYGGVYISIGALIIIILLLILILH